MEEEIKAAGEAMKRKLAQKLSEAMHENLIRPRLIVMHPLTWQSIVQSFDGMDFYYTGNPPFYFRGVKVLRSLDVAETEFEIV